MVTEKKKTQRQLPEWGMVEDVQPTKDQWPDPWKDRWKDSVSKSCTSMRVEILHLAG